MLPIANLKPSSSCNYGARREPLHNKPRSAKRSAKITLTTNNQRLMDKQLIRELMQDMEEMALTIEHEWGSCFTTLDDMIASNDMPDSYYTLLDLLEAP